MVFLMRVIRSVSRSNFTIIFVFLTIFMTFLGFRLHQKDKNQQQLDGIIQPVADEKILPLVLTTLTSATLATKVIDTPKVVEEKPLKAIEEKPAKMTEEVTKSENMFFQYSSDEHLHSLLRKQSNSQSQVIATIIGGDSYSLFAWDWYDRMLAMSNDTNNCHCFVIAMDEIAVVLAIQQGVPVFYSTFSFDQQMQWINNIEARQHSLYRVGHAKFDSTARIVRLGYSVVLSEMDVFWRKNPLDHLKQPLDTYDFQISHHYGAHPRVNIGLYFARSTNASILFFSHVAEFWIRYGKGGYLSDQRVLDALLNNYDRLDKTYLKAMKPLFLTFNWTTHDFGNHFSHLMTDGSAFILFNQAAKLGLRSNKFHGESTKKFFTVTVTNINMSISQRNLLIRALLILQYTQLQNRTLILPAFSSNITITPITYQIDIKKFLLYWKEEHIRLPDFLLLTKTASIPITTLSYSPKKTYEDINGILDLNLDSIPLNLPPPSPQFEVQIRDSLLWCSPPMTGGAWCFHHPRDFGATMEILFACRGDPYPPCANKTERNEQFLERPYEEQ